MPEEKGAPGTAPGAESDESFEALLERLETIVGQLEAGERPLDESLALYERGVSTLKRCHSILDRADKRIRMLLQDGQLREAEVPNRGERPDKSEKPSARRLAPPSQPAAPSEEEREEPEREDPSTRSGQDSASAREVHKKVENSADEPVDSEGETPHNSPTSVKSKSKTGQSGNKAGGLLFGSAQ